MKKSDTTYIVGSVFAAMVAVFYSSAMWFEINVPRYYPLEHVWKCVKEKSVPSQGWYGKQGFAYIAAGAVAMIVYLVLKYGPFKEMSLKPPAAKLLGVAVTLIVIVCMSYMLYYEFAKWGVF